MTKDDVLLAYTLRLGDNALILGQRMVELVASYPELEEELANANFALDYLGQARLYYSYAGELEGQGRSEDDFAFLREEREYRNALLLEQPNGHFGDSIAKLVLFELFYQLQLDALMQCRDERLAEIAARATKEIRYHVRHNTQWLVRLGDGTEESHQRIQASIDALWRYTGELFAPDQVDNLFEAEFDGPDLAAIGAQWQDQVTSVMQQATLELPDDVAMASGGKAGQHSEHLGYLLAEMQHLQRSYPGTRW